MSITAFTDVSDTIARGAVNVLPSSLETASGERWALRAPNARASAAIAQRAGIDPILADILSARGVAPDAVVGFLNPTLRDHLPDPFVLQDMEAATQRLMHAVVSGQTIGVFGDYDVDGTTASALIENYCRKIGVATVIHLPDRFLEGYGPSVEAFRSLRARGADLIVTVDCGAAAHEPVAAAAGEGLDVIVLDHHIMDGPGPAGACAVVNPNRPDDISALRNLSAAGVAFLAIVALNRALREAGFFADRAEPDLRGFLDLAALGLVCDVMPLTGVTRAIVHAGLKILDQRGNGGLHALGQVAGVRRPASAYDLGFLLGPRINAAGRIGHARLAFELLTSQDPDRQKELADHLHVLNAERQEVERSVQNAALSMIEAERLHENPVIVVAGEGWHPGVVGIVAGRLKDLYGKPAIVIAIADGIGKGSGRSLTGVDLGRAIAAARDSGLIIAGGGHEMAAGLTIDADKIPSLSRDLSERLEQDVKVARDARNRTVDAIIGASAVSAGMAQAVSAAGPFGNGNPEPQFAISELSIGPLREVGSGHYAFESIDPCGERFRAIAFRAADTALGALLRSAAENHDRVWLLGKIRADDWRGGNAAQLHVSDAAKLAG